MPHIAIENSANVESALDVPTLLKALNDAVAMTRVFPLQFVRTRASRRDIYRIADAKPENAFVAIVMRVAPGLTPEVRRSVGEAIFADVKSYVDLRLSGVPLSLTFEMSGIDQTSAFRSERINVETQALASNGQL